MNCWEFHQCGREAGGSNVAEMGVCPAYPERGRNCALVVGTHCEGRTQGTLEDKLCTCLHCAYYKSEHYARSG